MLSPSFGFITDRGFIFRKKDFAALCLDFAEGVADGSYQYVILRISVPVHETQVERFLVRNGVYLHRLLGHGVICKRNTLAADRRTFYTKILAGRDEMIKRKGSVALDAGGYWCFNRTLPKLFPPHCHEFWQMGI